MKTRFLLPSLAAAAALALPAFADAAEWTIDSAHSAAQFKVSHMMVSNVRGHFEGVEGKVVYDPAAPEKISIDAVIDAKTIDTREAKRDEHLRSPEFLDTEKHPKITFKSKSASVKGKGKLEVTGDLTIRGVTRPVVLAVTGLDKEAKDPWGNVKMGAVATTTIDRKDFGLTWNQVLETGGVLVGEDVEITIDVELNKVVAEKTAEASAD